MPQYRQHFITKEWVIIAPERAKRPDQFARKAGEKKPLPEREPTCPFCPGNENQTPPPTFLRKAGAGWGLRVVPNKFAAVNPDVSPERSVAGHFLSADGFGIAEVVVESPKHNTTLALMPADEVRGVIEAYRNRFLELSANSNIDLVTIFRNHGPAAGTSLAHPHSQIIATAIVPPHIRMLTEHSLVYHDCYRRCIYCDMLAEEMAQEKRIILESRHHVAFCPYASRTPFETMIMPKRHYARLDAIEPDELQDFAETLRLVLRKFHVGLNDPDYNFVVRTSSMSDGERHHEHLRLVITPRITTPAGFEIGSGIFINVMPPENAAAFLRETKAD